MNYRVILTPRAKLNLKTIHSYIVQQSSLAAGDWLTDAERAIDSLERHPERCALAAESLSFGKKIRELLFGTGNRGTYRVLFQVKGQTVYVLHVRHGSRLPLSASYE